MALALESLIGYVKMKPKHEDDFSRFIPKEVGEIKNHQTDLPRIAKDKVAIAAIEQSLLDVPTSHKMVNGDARTLKGIKDETCHLVLTSPPYWNLKKYADSDNQLGDIEDYADFISELNKVWKSSFRALVPGGRLICVVGDVCLSRKRNNGEHAVIPLHSSIQEACRKIGFTNLAPIIWHKISNAKFEASGNSGSFLGKPYEPNAVIKNDIEYILMFRKPGPYRSVSLDTRILSVISESNHKKWFNQIWQGVTGASTKNHPAPYPIELAQRLIRMFSFVGDTVVDPFMGTGTTAIAAAQSGRNSISYEINESYLDMSVLRFEKDFKRLTSNTKLEVFK
jgi:modification methylase